MKTMDLHYNIREDYKNNSCTDLGLLSLYHYDPEVHLILLLLTKDEKKTLEALELISNIEKDIMNGQELSVYENQINKFNEETIKFINYVYTTRS